LTDNNLVNLRLCNPRPHARKGDNIMIETTRRLLAVASICAATAVLLTASTAEATAIPPPEGGIQLPPTETTSPVLVGDFSGDNVPTSSGQPTPAPPRIVQVEKSWIETWAVGGRRPLSQAGPPRPDNQAWGNKEDPSERESTCDADQPEGSPPRIIIFGDEHRDEAKQTPRKHRQKREQGGEQWPEIRMILKSYNDLIEFYETQGHEEQAEQVLRERIDVCSKLAELRMLAEFDGPGAAMQEYYRYIDRPDRAIELDLHNMEREIDHLERERADLEAQISRLSGQYDILERRIDELRDRHEQRTDELSDLQAQPEARDEDDEDAAEMDGETAPPRKQRIREAAMTALQDISLRLLSALLL